MALASTSAACEQTSYQRGAGSPPMAAPRLLSAGALPKWTSLPMPVPLLLL